MPTTSGATSASFSKSSTSISSSRRKPFLFLSNLWRRKKVLEIDDLIFDRELNHRTRSEPSVISYTCTSTTVPSASMLTMTPGRCRDIDQDMHALRLSRQDNPFVQKVLASRESLIDTLDDTVSDDAILMAEELNPDCDGDPFTMPEVQEHMIRSPPPTSWPRSSPQYMFTYNQDNNLTISSHSSEEDCGSFYNSHNSTRAQDLFLRTTSVPAAAAAPPAIMGTTPMRGSYGGARSESSSNNNNGGLNIALSRPKSNSVNMSSHFGVGRGGGQGSQLNADSVPGGGGGGSMMIIRPKCLYDEAQLRVGSFK